ncbi:PREDICTED: nuclear hormone receptor FTZ-F1-like, partial [Priapulus caudatus]|uniref:Nuclear hormone receptor FTZ-F1-like n=1 Tax=Priapulus caudatus TaxID=37621 RepID=A0ABM1EDY5_PRICU
MFPTENALALCAPDLQNAAPYHAFNADMPTQQQLDCTFQDLDYNGAAPYTYDTVDHGHADSMLVIPAGGSASNMVKAPLAMQQEYAFEPFVHTPPPDAMTFGDPHHHRHHLHHHHHAAAIDIKGDLDELCPVCGDVVSGYHYGLLTCESCKGFFKRTVQNKKVYSCAIEKKCVIDKQQRKRCPYCRFQKCIEVGMKLEAVRPDRMRGGRNKFGPMYKRDRARKMQVKRRMLAAKMGGMCQYDGTLTLTATRRRPPPPWRQDIKRTYHSCSSSHVRGGHRAQDTADAGLERLAALCRVLDNSLFSLVEWARRSHFFKDLKVCCTMRQIALEAHARSFKKRLLSWDYFPRVQTALRTPPLIIELRENAADDKLWRDSLFSIIYSQTYAADTGADAGSTFELMCRVLDNSLFSLVEWARRSHFFKDLKVDDQMKLLHVSWSEMLMLDHIYQHSANGLPDETRLPNGQKFSLANMCLFGFTNMADRLEELFRKLRQLKFDRNDYICLKFLILMNPDVPGLLNPKVVESAQEKVNCALLEYCETF